MKPVKDIKTTDSINGLLREMKDAGGFSAKNLGDAVDIFEKMIKEKDNIKFLSFPACIMATGTRGIILEMVKNKMVDVVITTCGTMDHDLARMWKDYYHGSFLMDDRELHEEGVNRLGNVLVPNDSYGVILEKKCAEILENLYEKQKDWSTKELVWAFGEALDEEENKEESFSWWCWKNQIPVFIPGPTDGSWGSQMWMFWQDHKDFNINLLRDEQELAEIVWDTPKSSAIMVGGGISKHHVIWWNQFRDGLDYGIYITTAPEWDGSLSGARMREAISWGKVKEEAELGRDYVDIEGDATIILPLLVSAVKERL